MIPIQYKLLAGGLALAMCAGIGWAVVAKYNSAIEQAQAAKQVTRQLYTQVRERNAVISAWQKREKALLALHAEDAKALTTKTAEAEAAAKRIAKLTGDYRHAIANLPQAERDCAAMPVPAAVDGLLSGAR